MERRLILIGGSSGSGKSTTARLLAKELDAGWLQVDTLWVALQGAFASDEAVSRLLQVDRRLRESDEPAQTLVEHQIAAGRFVCSVIPKALWAELQAHDTLVADGAWLLPEFAANLKIEGATVFGAYLQEPDAVAVRRALDSRRVSKQPQRWHAQVANVSWAYGNWLAEEARRFGLPVVAARPRGSLVARLRTALGV